MRSARGWRWGSEVQSEPQAEGGVGDAGRSKVGW